MLSETSVTKVIVHLLVLLSVVDHFKRKLLGCWRSKSVLDVSNSFAVPFDEDNKDKSVNVRERLVGWNHTGPKLCQNEISINERRIS
ncbi:hypothetical protein quinque_008350 [Culex quinquefasciatus]